MKYDLVDLKLLMAIAEASNVTTGAAACFLSPSAASLRLRNLEEAIGTILFERHARGVSLTEAGRVMLKHARACFQVLQVMHVDLADYASGAKSFVRILANGTSGTSALLDDIQPILAQHAGLRVSIDAAESSDIVSSVASGRVELGVVLAGHEHSELNFLDYRQEELVVIAPRGQDFGGLDSISFAECLSHRMVCLTEQAPLQRQLVAAAKALGGRVEARAHVSSYASMIRLVRWGLGIGILPREEVSEELRPFLHTVRLEDEWARRRLQVCCPKANTGVSRAARLLYDHLSTLKSMKHAEAA